MKRIQMLLLLMVAAVVSIQAQKTYVLLTGVNNYGTGQNDLLYPVKDAKELKQVFDRQGATVAILTSKYVTRKNIDRKLDAIMKLAGPEDKIIFFFSGHGCPSAFCCYGFDLYPYSELAEKLSKARTKQVFCFIDACHSGSAQFSITGGNNLEGTQPVFCMACRPGEYSVEKYLFGNGIFTQALTKALRGKADYNGDSKVTLSETFKYVHADVKDKSHGNQHPQLAGSSTLFDTVLTQW